jgi:hypothetical protein
MIILYYIIISPGSFGTATCLSIRQGSLPWTHCSLDVDAFAACRQNMLQACSTFTQPLQTRGCKKKKTPCFLSEKVFSLRGMCLWRLTFHGQVFFLLIANSDRCGAKSDLGRMVLFHGHARSSGLTRQLEDSARQHARP